MIFGWGHFKLYSCSLEKAGISDVPPGIDYEIEIRQRYFHLFFIPFFSLGKIWGVRKDGKFLHLSEKYKHFFQHRTKVRTAWYTYSGIYLVLIATLLVYFLV